jgi:hypothetical protein
MTMLTLASVAEVAITIVIVVLYGIAFSQIYRPWQPEPRGDSRRRVRLALRARARLHAVWLWGVAGVLVAAHTVGLPVTVWPWLAGLAAGVALLACPVSYTVTEHGITVGNTRPRRWTEFAGVTARNGWIYLQPVGGARGLLVRAPRRSGCEAWIAELRGLVRGAYKGQLGLDGRTAPLEFAAGRVASVR